MKQNKWKRYARTATAALLLAGLVGGAFPAPIDQTIGFSTYAQAVGEGADILKNADWSITEYAVSRNCIEKDDRTTVSVTLKDPSTKLTSNNQIKASDIDATALVSSFNGAGSPTVTILSTQTGEALRIRLDFPNARYLGSGNTFSFQVGYDGDYQDLDLTVRECREYVEPEPEPEEEPDPLDEPVLQIGRGSIPNNLTAGQTFSVDVWVKNLGDADIENGMLTVSPSSGLTVADASPSYSFGRLRDGKVEHISVDLRVLETADTENQSIDVSVRFRYDDEASSALKTGSAEQELLIPVTLPPENDTAPIVQIGRHNQPKAIAKGETQTVSIWIRNLSEVDLKSVLATVTPSSDLMIADNGSTYLIGTVLSGGTVVFDVRVKAAGDIASIAQSLDVSLKYNYLQGRTTTQGSTDETVPLSAIVTPGADGNHIAASTPNIIISNYTYGGTQVTAGTTFDLTLEFKNTSASKRVENIVMTLDTGTALAITSSSNSFHFPRMNAGAVLSQTVNLQALPDAPSAPATIGVSFSYEYLDNESRQNVTVDQTISLPVYQLDRFELTQDNPSIEAWQFEESYLTLSYVNKGKSTVYNVAAELVGDIGAASRVQNVGNIEAGRSGTIDFIITPEMAGQNECTLVITYEDDAMQLMTKEFTFQVFVNEMYFPEEPIMDDPAMMEPEESGPNLWIILLVLAAAAGAVVIVLRRRKKKKAAGEVDSFTFDDDLMIDMSDAPAEAPAQPAETDGEGAHEST
ncbi:MAG: hypothetical protein IKM54_01290 [Butyricicoccus sp.]|nr:hypothetical protein [Butyricicoccus sp.]